MRHALVVNVASNAVSNVVKVLVVEPFVRVFFLLVGY